MAKLSRALIITCLMLLSSSALSRDLNALADWRGRVIYFPVIDRFVNGDAGNDNAHGDPDCNRAWDAHAFQGGDLSGLTSKMDYVRSLGADALWLTPLYKGVPQRQGANCGFPGYWAEFSEPYQFELDPRFGTKGDFDALLYAAHTRGIKVVLDMVVNHAGYAAPLTWQRPQWFNDPARCYDRGRPAIDCPLAGLPDFNHDRADVRRYLTNLHRQWLDRFEIDGIRMDTVKHVDPAYFRDDWLPAMRQRRPELFIFGELLEENFARYPTYLEAGFDSLFNFHLRRAMITTFAQGHSTDHLASAVAEVRQRFGVDQADLMINLLDNHDVPRFLNEMPVGVQSHDQQQRYELAMTALLTLPGIPQIYYGNEIGMYGGQDPDNRRPFPDWAFSSEGRQGTYPGFLPRPDAVFQLTRRLLSLRQAWPALRRGGYVELWRQNGAQNANFYAFARRLQDQTVIVVINNGALPASAALPIQVGHLLPDGSRLTDQLGGQREVIVRNGLLPINLPGRNAAIFTVQP